MKIKAIHWSNQYIASNYILALFIITSTFLFAFSRFCIMRFFFLALASIIFLIGLIFKASSSYNTRRILQVQVASISYVFPHLL